ncbi:MATE family efflux transporter [Bacillus sp. HMF5848]|uniref:MATE family efflux transporter n=1 Tax=Bacillus sp. HMF5848 TaxID=2495421 RepID=UPI000F784D25|nr:MATE family efflux transporter [Bacillus sp. HMF5848]RSK27263.1 MATE family efflux transporter [Bacillus sp. HMF5848]
MFETNTLKEKLILLLKVLVPIFITQVGMYAMNFIDTVMSGQASPEDLAGVAIGSSIWIPVFTGISGILISLTPIISQLVGANTKESVGNKVVQGLYLSIVLAFCIVIAGFFLLNPILSMMKLDETVRFIAKNYLIALSLGIFPVFIYNVLRNFIDALGQTRFTMFITLAALPVNILFNYILIFGKWGFPKLGGVGAGYASAITYWFIFIIAIIIVNKVSPFHQFQIFSKLYPFHFRDWIEQLTIGIPIGFAIFFETSIFAAVTLLMSAYNTETIAAHQAALNFASFLYMVPLSVASALTIAIGFEIGAKRYSHAKQYSYLGIGFAIIVALLFAVLLYITRPYVALLYSQDSAVLKLTSQFLFYAIFFQLADAFGAPIQGILRGYKDVNAVFVLSLISYWVIGLPLGYVLAQYTSLMAFGYWVGLSGGLTAGAILLFLRLKYMEKKLQNNYKNYVS